MQSWSKKGRGRNKDSIPFTEVPISWPHLRLSHGWYQSQRKGRDQWWFWEGAQAAESAKKDSSSIPKAADGRPRVFCGFLLKESREYLWQQHQTFPGLEICTLFPSSFWKLLQEGTLWGQSWGWLPVLLVDYSHLFPSSTKCANHENISQWLACHNPPTSNKPNVDQN